MSGWFHVLWIPCKKRLVWENKRDRCYMKYLFYMRSWNVTVDKTERRETGTREGYEYLTEVCSALNLHLSLCPDKWFWMQGEWKYRRLLSIFYNFLFTILRRCRDFDMLCLPSETTRFRCRDFDILCLPSETTRFDLHTFWKSLSSMLGILKSLKYVTFRTIEDIYFKDMIK